MAKRNPRERFVLVDESGWVWIDAELTKAKALKLIKAYERFGVYLKLESVSKSA